MAWMRQPVRSRYGPKNIIFWTVSTQTSLRTTGIERRSHVAGEGGQEPLSFMEPARRSENVVSCADPGTVHNDESTMPAHGAFVVVDGRSDVSSADETASRGHGIFNATA